MPNSSKDVRSALIVARRLTCGRVNDSKEAPSPEDSGVVRSRELANAHGKRAAQTKASGGPIDPSLLQPGEPITAYHGSPHQFDQFDASKVGAGEGSQAYGHGLYFAQNENVARDYRDKLSRGHSGHMYQVGIKAHPDHFLDWDKKLSEQHPTVQQALRSEAIPPVTSFLGGMRGKRYMDVAEHFTGQDIVHALGRDDPNTSKSLSAAGIPGIKYLDQGSRGTGQGTQNYVVFDPKHVGITRRYAQGGDVIRAHRAAGGSLSDAISSFSKDREAQFNRPSGNSDAALLAALQSQHPQLAVAEPPEQRKQSQASGVADLGAQIDEGAKWLSGTQDDSAPVKGSLSTGVAKSGQPSAQSQPAHPGGPSHSNVDQNSAAMHMMDRLVSVHGWTPAAAAIAAGNAMQESGFQPSVAGDASIPGGSHGYAQWNRDRFVNLQGFAKQQGTDWTNPDTQIDFLANEAKDRVPGWSTQPDLSQARPISKAYEGYGIEGNRVPDASKFYDMYQSRPQPQQAQGAAPPPAQPQDATGGPLSEADPMTNANQAKRGGLMRRKHFDDGGDSGGDGGDGDGAAAAAAAAADAAAAGFGGNSGVTGAPAGMGTSVGFGGGQGGTDAGVGGDNGFGGANGFGTSVGVNAPGNANAATGFGGVASPGNNGFGGGNAAAAGNSAPGGAGGVSTAGVGHGGGNGGGGSGVSSALANAYGASQMEGGHGGGGNGASAAPTGNMGVTAADLYAQLGGTPAYYAAGFGLGPGGVGNAAAAQSDTATMRGLIGGVAPGIRGIGAGVAPGYGFASVQGNDPSLAASNTGQAALAQAHSGVSAQQALAQMQSTMSPSQVDALNSQLAMLRSGGVQGYGNAGFGGGSPSATVGGFGGNSSPTGAEGVSTASLGAPSVGVGAPSGPPGFASSVNANAPSPNAQNVEGIGNPAAAPAVSTPNNHSAPSGPGNGGGQYRYQAQNAVEHQNRGGYLHRASGGIASMPTDELIELALNRIRQRRNAATGGSQNKNGSQGGISFAALAPPSPGGPSTQAQYAYDLGLGGIGPSSSYNPASAEGEAWTAQQNQQDAPAPANTPPNMPAITSGTVGNHGGYGAVGSSGSSGSPISGVPNANSAPPQYNNTLDQVLGTNNPSMDQIFGFTYPTPPPPKPQPQGPVSQDTINALSMFGQGSQVFASGGAIIMDAALNKARKAIRAKGGRVR